MVPKEDFSRKQERDEEEEPKAAARLGRNTDCALLTYSNGSVCPESYVHRLLGRWSCEAEVGSAPLDAVCARAKSASL